MGIPSYFSYIVKQHSNVIRKLDNTMKINNFYIDANSIIYDAIHKIDFNNLTDTDVNTIIHKVINKIDDYIHTIKPDTYVFIAFDGVAPVAKLEQQRQRRYKSFYLSQIQKDIFKHSKPDTWNTAAITPGTVFMTTLNEQIRLYYNDPNKYGLKNIILSTSDKSGEGEHKIFQFIRDFDAEHSESTTVIYGLDADLIMLSINHLPICKKIYLYRETPHFIQSINSELEPDTSYLMDIPQFANYIINDMNNGAPLNTKQQTNRIYDYIFLCFFLGNDFMPHFPSLNIRTDGIHKLLNAYKLTIGDTNDNLTDGKKIYWKNLRKLIQVLADNEEEYFQNETKKRDRAEKHTFSTDTPEEQFKRFEATPIYERHIEKYINPFNSNWQTRYYKSLFYIDINDIRRKQICINFLEALEWNFKYYSTGCPDWRWCYSYNYPPLFTDLIHFIPYFDTEFVVNQPPRPVNQITQLGYVLPKQSLYLLHADIRDKLTHIHPEWYRTDCKFIWAYCKYFWEAHVELPEIDIIELEQIVHSYIVTKNK